MSNETNETTATTAAGNGQMNTAGQAETALVPRQRAPLEFEPQNFSDAWRMAEVFSQSALVPKHLRGKPHDVMLTILHGRELGISPVRAMQMIHVIEGKPGVEAKLAVALVKKERSLCRYFIRLESTNERAVYETQREGEPAPIRQEFTIEDAERAGLLGKDNWTKYPGAMLRARASMALARDVYPDLVGNLYDQDELDEIRAMSAREQMQTVAPPPPPRPVPQSSPAPAPRTPAVIETTATSSAPKPAAGPQGNQAPAAGAPSNDQGAPAEQAEQLSESQVEELLEAAQSPADVEKLKADVRRFAGENTNHKLRHAYNAAYKRTRQAMTGQGAAS